MRSLSGYAMREQHLCTDCDRRSGRAFRLRSRRSAGHRGSREEGGYRKRFVGLSLSSGTASFRGAAFSLGGGDAIGRGQGRARTVPGETGCVPRSSPTDPGAGAFPGRDGFSRCSRVAGQPKRDEMETNFSGIPQDATLSLHGRGPDLHL